MRGSPCWSGSAPWRWGRGAAVVGARERIRRRAHRVADLILVFPALVLALVIRALLGPGVVNIIVALGVTIMPALARVIRGEVLSLRERDFVTAAVAVGARHSRILVRHIVPNVLDLIVVLGAIYTGGAILTEASLSFLGFGTPPPAPSWGRMLQEGYSFLP